MKPYPPLGLLYLSAYLKRAGFSVEVYDSTFGERAAWRRGRRSARRRLGIYTNLMTRRTVLDIVRAAKQHRWTVVLGGPESANYVAEYLGAGADVIVIGEGEVDARRVCCRRCPRRRAPPARCARHRLPRRSRRASCAPRRARQDPGSRHPALAGPRSHRSPAVLDAWKTHHGAAASISSPRAAARIAATGARTRCTAFTHRRRSPANVADEMQWIVERYDPDQVWYADDVFTISHPWLASYTAELERRGIHRPFETITRADRLQNEGAAALLRELGCYRIWIGSESGSQKILDAMQRGVRVEQVRKRLRARAGARHPGRHVPDVGLRRRGIRGHRRHGRTRQGDQPRHLLHDRVLSHQGHGLLRQGARARARRPSPGRKRPIATT